MYKHKKVFCFLLTLLLALVFVMAGCGGQGAKSNENTASGTEQTQTEAVTSQTAAPEPVTLKWSYLNYAQLDDLQMVEDELNKQLTQKLPNTTLKLDPVDYGTYEDKINMKIAAQDMSDIMWFGYKYPLSTVVPKGVVVPIDPLLEKNAPKLKALLPQYLWDAAKINGKLYAVPNYQVETYHWGVYIVKELADKYKLDTANIKKLTDLEPFLQNVKENEPGYYPIRQDGAATLKRISSVFPELYGLDNPIKYEELAGNNTPGIRYTLDNGAPKVVNIYTTKEYKDYLDLMRQWFVKGYLRQDIASVTDDGADSSAGKYAIEAGNHTIGSEIAQGSGTGHEVIYIPLGNPYVLYNAPTLTVNCITSLSKNPDRAMQLLELVNTDKDFYNMLCHGIENVHYTKISDNGYDVVKDSKYNPGLDWVYGDQFNSYILKGNPPDIWEQTIKLNGAATPSPIIGFTFNNEPVKTQLTQIASVLKEYSVIETGTLPDYGQKLTEMVDKLNKAGMNDVIAEMQKQLDEFMKTK